MATVTLSLDDLAVSTFETGGAGAIETDTTPYSPYCCTEDNSGCDTGPETGCDTTQAA